MTDKNIPAPVASPEEVEKLRAALEQDWGTFIAVQPISFNGAPAYNVGDPVPASNVQRHGYEAQGLVAKVTTKAGQDVARQLHAATADLGVVEVQPPVSLNIPVKD